MSPTCISTSTRDCCPTSSTMPAIGGFLETSRLGLEPVGSRVERGDTKRARRHRDRLAAQIGIGADRRTLTLGTSAPVASFTTPVRVAVGT